MPEELNMVSSHMVIIFLDEGHGPESAMSVSACHPGSHNASLDQSRRPSRARVDRRLEERQRAATSVGDRAIPCLLTWDRVKLDVRDRLHLSNMPSFVPTTLRYEPKRGSIELSHFRGGAKDAEEDDRMKDVDPFIPLHLENSPIVGAPIAGWCL